MATGHKSSRPPDALAYVNRKGVTYYLHEGHTKTGKRRYFFARTIREGALAELPPGYEVAESVNGVVSARRHRAIPSAASSDDLARVQAELQRHPHLRHHVARALRDGIVVYQPDVDLAGLRETARHLGAPPGRVQAFLEDRIKRASMSPVLRFVADGTTWVVLRMTYRGDGGWSYPLASGSLDELARRFVRKVGTDDFFELM